MKAIKINYIILTTVLLLLMSVLSSVARAEEDAVASDIAADEGDATEEIVEVNSTEVVADPHDTINESDFNHSDSSASENESNEEQVDLTPINEILEEVVDEEVFSSEDLVEVESDTEGQTELYEEHEVIAEVLELIEYEEELVNIIPQSRQDCLQHLRAYYTHPGACMAELLR